MRNRNMIFSTSLLLASIPLIVNAETFQLITIMDGQSQTAYRCAHPIATNMIGLDAQTAETDLAICQSQQSKFVLNNYWPRGAEMTLGGVAVGIRINAPNSYGRKFLCLRGSDATCTSENFHVDTKNRLRMSSGDCVDYYYGALISRDCVTNAVSKDGVISEGLEVQVPQQFRIRTQSIVNGTRFQKCVSINSNYVGFGTELVSCDTESSLFRLVGNNLFLDSKLIGKRVYATKHLGTKTEDLYMPCPVDNGSDCKPAQFMIDAQNKLKVRNGMSLYNAGELLCISNRSGILYFDSCSSGRNLVSVNLP